MPKFQKGHPGGPGRPKGSRNKAPAEFDEIAREDCIEEAVGSFGARAARGDVPAAKVLFDLFWPEPRSR